MTAAIEYEIRVQGHIDANWSDWFDGLTVTNTDDGETILSGPMADQSALLGVLARLHALNMQLLAVRRLARGLSDVLDGPGTTGAGAG
jgi:hypothetical protein